ncbi:HS12A-like protein [Mya arenaria]|uniref:HS12A-like protein n=1 Tax=Mya arenaria TaxID=6604 RepID=A0ABY7EQN0_MYAAR|nr:HS12A-like protein [Mya arenaria]
MASGARPNITAPLRTARPACWGIRTLIECLLKAPFICFWTKGDSENPPTISISDTFFPTSDLRMMLFMCWIIWSVTFLKRISTSDTFTRILSPINRLLCQFFKSLLMVLFTSVIQTRRKLDGVPLPLLTAQCPLDAFKLFEQFQMVVCLFSSKPGHGRVADDGDEELPECVIDCRASPRTPGRLMDLLHLVVCQLLVHRDRPLQYDNTSRIFEQIHAHTSEVGDHVDGSGASVGECVLLRVTQLLNGQVLAKQGRHFRLQSDLQELLVDSRLQEVDTMYLSFLKAHLKPPEKVVLVALLAHTDVCIPFLCLEAETNDRLIIVQQQTRWRLDGLRCPSLYLFAAIPGLWRPDLGWILRVVFVTELDGVTRVRCAEVQGRHQQNVLPGHFAASTDASKSNCRTELFRRTCLSCNMADTDYFMIAAIDFGTTYSGYAFQLTSEYDPKNPTKKILCPQAWNEGPTKLTSMKTPSCLLLDNNKDLDCFGYMAEDKYADLCMDGDNHNFYFFRRFKMELHDTQGLNKNTEIADMIGRKLPALLVFSKSIEALKTVHQCSFRHCQAGIPTAHLTIALEPEAASLFCQYLPVEKFSVGGTSGGTADITVHEKVSSGKLKEVHRASGGPWGGTFVDSEFITLLSNIVGGPVFAAFMKQQRYDYLELMREFESVKRNVGLNSTDAVKMKIPVSLSETCEKVVHKDFKELVKIARKDKHITFVGDKAKFDANLMKGLFKKATDKIVHHIKNILTKEVCGRRVSLILMVGGFSESAYIQDVVKSEFHDKGGKKVLIPKDAGISVVQGAVVYGRQPGNITSRVLRYSYGVAVSPEFVQGQHEPSRLQTIAGVDRCSDVFSKFMDIGTNVNCGFQKHEGYKTIDPHATCCTFKIYTADDSNSTPAYTDESGCRFLGSLDVKYPQGNEIRDISVDYIFGDTELHIKATDVKSKTPCEAKLRMFE